MKIFVKYQDEVIPVHWKDRLLQPGRRVGSNRNATDVVIYWTGRWRRVYVNEAGDFYIKTRIVTGPNQDAGVVLVHVLDGQASILRSYFSEWSRNIGNRS